MEKFVQNNPILTKTLVLTGSFFFWPSPFWLARCGFTSVGLINASRAFFFRAVELRRRTVRIFFYYFFLVLLSSSFFFYPYLPSYFVYALQPYAVFSSGLFCDEKWTRQQWKGHTNFAVHLLNLWGKKNAKRWDEWCEKAWKERGGEWRESEPEQENDTQKYLLFLLCLINKFIRLYAHFVYFSLCSYLSRATDKDAFTIQIGLYIVLVRTLQLPVLLQSCW